MPTMRELQLITTTQPPKIPLDKLRTSVLTYNHQPVPIKHRPNTEKRDAWHFHPPSFAIDVAQPTERRRYFAPPVAAPSISPPTAPSATLSPACWCSSTSSINATALSSKSAKAASAPSTKPPTPSSPIAHWPSKK